MVLPSITSTAPSVHFTYPPSSLLKYSPSSNPGALSPPVSDFTLARPFNINPELYNNALRISVPLTIAIIYATTVVYVNGVNKRRNYKPWSFSNTFAFYAFVVSHNIFLAIYSGWTFVGMLNAIRKSWPGIDGQYALAGAADALCKMHGPRGLGSAATYNVSSSRWGFTDRAMKLAEGSPDTTDVGRIWNEGLAFYGWLFYLSKFYEVIDTAIILAKGKKSSNLQTFHHTGAMLCMWAGIRYMSPPIWMFTFINSGLHTLMYTYYTLSALTIQVPRAMKRTLTSLQIAQIIFGGSYALAHLFVSYDVPIAMPYLYAHNLSTALPSTASTISSAISSAFTSAAAAGIGNWLKKAALRAAGEEGLAENVRNYQGETFGIDAIHAADVEKAQQEIRYRMGTQRVHCLDTSGEVFAILLNLIYLAPLATLFIRYFSRSYLNRVDKSDRPKPSKQENFKASSKDAAKEMEREIQEAMSGKQGGTTEPPPETKVKIEKAKSDAKQGASDLNDKVQKNAKDTSAKIQKAANDVGNRAKDAAGDYPEKAKDAANDMSAKAQKAGKDVKEFVNDDLKALQEKMRKMGGEGAKFSKSALNFRGKDDQSDSESRSRSPVKRSEPKKEEDKVDVDVKEEDNKPETDRMAQSYEVVPDEPKTEEMKKAEEDMQPEQE